MSLNNEKPIPFLPGHQFSDPYVFNYNKVIFYIFQIKERKFSQISRIFCCK